MASLITCAITSIGWCFCTASASLLSSCCGNDKASTIPPSATSGRKRSIVLLVLSIGIALGFQYGAAPAIIESTVIPTYLRNAWLDGCNQYYNDDPALTESCAGNNGVYRAFGAATLFFLLAAIAASCRPTANREAWPAKFVLFLFLCAATVFIPNQPVFSDIYLNVGRIGGVVFIFLQQIVILDMAYEWNDSWVKKAEDAESEEAGSGQLWLGAILFSCAVLFIGSLVFIVLMFVYFTGCPTNEAFISVTLILGVAITAAQLSGEEGSLLASACIFAWAAFLCYTAVSKNPNGQCNPMLGSTDRLSITLSIIVTVISLGWTGWSYTAEDKLVNNKTDDGPEQSLVDDKSREERKVTGVVVTGQRSSYGTDGGQEQQENDAGAGGQDGTTASDTEAAAMNNPQRLSNSWKLNIILASIACWTSMALTNWGAIVAGGNVANPSAGNVGMWMVIASQWLVLVLYCWTLVAPRLFPDRDFS